ncbi:MAG: hypothetical protein K0R34_848 [Herbinix sp.]|jgi:hypothetical protein|nr:hypothetical protein [Herbinix sp.]
MDTTRKLFVGYDLCEDYTQISCYSYKSGEPIPISVREEDERNLIPTALCVNSVTKQWLFGEDAIRCGTDNAGILVNNLLDKLIKGVEVRIYDQTFSPVSLMEKYLRKTLMLIKRYFPTEQISKIVVTVRNAQPALVEGIYAALAILGLERDRVVIMSHSGAYLYYALSQDKSLWMNDVGLFDFSEEGLLFYQIKLNRKTKPMIACLNKTDYSHILNDKTLSIQKDNLAYTFENIANTALYKKLVTTLYLSGTGFDGGWAEEVIRSLCVGRRVFLGQNLFTKGACYAAKELCGDRKLEEFILLNEEMIASTVAVRVYKDTKFQEVCLASAGETWYEVNKSIEVIQEGETELELILKNIMTREVIRERIRLTKLTDRPDRMTRLQIKVTCKDQSIAVVTVNDLGFGEFYPETGCILEAMIEI